MSDPYASAGVAKMFAGTVNGQSGAVTPLDANTDPIARVSPCFNGPFTIPPAIATYYDHTFDKNGSHIWSARSAGVGGASLYRYTWPGLADAGNMGALVASGLGAGAAVTGIGLAVDPYGFVFMLVQEASTPHTNLYRFDSALTTTLVTSFGFSIDGAPWFHYDRSRSWIVTRLNSAGTAVQRLHMDSSGNMVSSDAYTLFGGRQIGGALASTPDTATWYTTPAGELRLLYMDSNQDTGIVFPDGNNIVNGVLLPDPVNRDGRIWTQHSNSLANLGLGVTVDPATATTYTTERNECMDNARFQSARYLHRDQVWGITAVQNGVQIWIDVLAELDI